MFVIVKKEVKIMEFILEKYEQVIEKGLGGWVGGGMESF